MTMKNRKKYKLCNQRLNELAGPTNEVLKSFRQVMNLARAKLLMFGLKNFLDNRFQIVKITKDF